MNWKEFLDGMNDYSKPLNYDILAFTVTYGF